MYELRSGGLDSRGNHRPASFLLLASASGLDMLRRLFVVQPMSFSLERIAVWLWYRGICMAAAATRQKETQSDSTPTLTDTAATDRSSSNAPCCSSTTLVPAIHSYGAESKGSK
mmetsp:Transcript_22035/g.48037  ORF Transcript_22035/g.48037 Transcript_22035/m.48037 type:complete len:114 (+) Transcript_22035:2106-2447(+)